jgi:hypothetical protein
MASDSWSADLQVVPAVEPTARTLAGAEPWQIVLEVAAAAAVVWLVAVLCWCFWRLHKKRRGTYDDTESERLPVLTSLNNSVDLDATVDVGGLP